MTFLKSSNSLTHPVQGVLNIKEQIKANIIFKAINKDDIMCQWFKSSRHANVIEMKDQRKHAFGNL
jgi:hypothetical protein